MEDFCLTKEMVVQALLFLLCLGAVGQDRDTREIKLLSGTLKPAPGIDQAVLEQAAGKEPGDRIYVLLQLREIPTPDDVLRLSANGVTLERYVPYNTWVAGIPAQNVSALPADDALKIRWIGPWQGMDKVAPLVRSGEFPSWAVHSSGRVQVMVILHKDATANEGTAAAERHQGIVAGHLVGPHALTVWIMPERIPALAAEEGIVMWIAEGTPPLSETNDGARDALFVNTVQDPPYNLDGTGVTLFVFDGGAASSHIAFSSRLTFLTGDGASTSSHATHVTGTAVGDGAGNAPAGRDLSGSAPNADIVSGGYSQSGGVFFHDNSGDLETDYGSSRTNHDVDLSNNSIGSNLAQNGFPCNLEGNYGVTSELLDGIVRGDNAMVPGTFIIFWAAGNERGVGTCGAAYGTINPPASAKNPIHVAATYSDGDGMTTFSGFGPTDDGRLKPIVSGPGCETGVLVDGEGGINSCQPGDLYGLLCGTSMSTPAVSGLAALAIQHYRNVVGNGTARPLPALMKAWLIQTARDQGTRGPDYIFGYGQVDAVGIMDLITAQPNYLTDEISASREDDTYVYAVPGGATELKVSLAWDDFPAPAFSAVTLINDLDLEVESPSSTVHFPFTLNPVQPEAAASTAGANTVDNQEQVIIANPEPGNWTIRVRGASVPQAPQSYALTYTHALGPDDCTELITNGDFENGLTDWVTTNGTVVPDPAGGGNNVLLLGNDTVAHEAYQVVTIPADADNVNLAFDYYMTTQETGTAQNDLFTARVRDLSGNNLAVVDVRSNTWPTGTWVRNDFSDVSRFAGQTVRILFRGNNSGSLPTSYYIDNVNLESCVSSIIATDLAVSLTMDTAQPVTPGATVTYTLTATNNGPADADNVVVTQTFADHFTVQGNDCGQTVQSPFTWDVGTLTSGNSETCEVMVLVGAGTLCHVDSTAEITGNVADTNTSNDSFTGATVTITDQLLPNLPDWPGLSIQMLVPLVDCQPPPLAKKLVTHGEPGAEGHR